MQYLLRLLVTVPFVIHAASLALDRGGCRLANFTEETTEFIWHVTRSNTSSLPIAQYSLTVFEKVDSYFSYQQAKDSVLVNVFDPAEPRMTFDLHYFIISTVTLYYSTILSYH